MTLYEALGVSPDATAGELKAAYRGAVKLHHPDTGGDPDAFMRVRRAYAVLSDPERRDRYDRTGVEEDASAADDREAYAAMAALLLRTVEGTEDLRRVDVVGKIRDALRHEEAAHLAARRSLEERLDRIDVLKHRLRRTDEDDDVLRRLLLDRRGALEEARGRELDSLRVIGRALELLGRYSYAQETSSPGEAAIWSALKTGL